MNTVRLPRIVTTCLCALLVPVAFAKKPALELGGVVCETPPPLHCPDANCPGTTTSQTGSAVEAKSGRTFFLDYPCDLNRGEKVTFILILQGPVLNGYGH